MNQLQIQCCECHKFDRENKTDSNRCPPTFSNLVSGVLKNLNEQFIIYLKYA